MKIVFENFQAPGDIVAMTGAIRDLKRAHPEYQIQMDTSCPDIWINNPHLSHFSTLDSDVVKYKLSYDDIHNSNQSGRHFTSAFHMCLEELLKIRLIQTEIWPDLHLSDLERGSETVLQKSRGYTGKYWIINAGYKCDFTLKHWGHNNYQKVVDLLKGKVQFVQVGEDSPGHNHLPLDGAINLIGMTGLRDFIKLMYKADGSLGPVSMHMHIAAAFKKPCVIIAGGREPWRWEAYPNQRYINTNGFLPCCNDKGCWKNWHQAEGKEQHSDIENWQTKCCENEKNGRAKCMEMITPERVAEEILGYYEGVLSA